MIRRLLPLLLLATACSTSADTAPRPDAIVVTTSSIVADVVGRIAGDHLQVVSIIPNGFDSHNYEPRPSEIAMLTDAQLIVMADRSLNAAVSQLATLAGDPARILDLNATALSESELLLRNNGSGWNPHTWTDPALVRKWVTPIKERLIEMDPARADEYTANAAAYVTDLDALDVEISRAFESVPPQLRRLVVYHDAWEYFARRYNLELVGVLQAIDFSEPSASEIEQMAAEIRSLSVPAFFGSEVFPSDVLEVLEAESGARYIPDLADDRLPGTPDDASYSYVGLMTANLKLLLEGLAG